MHSQISLQVECLIITVIFISLIILIMTTISFIFLKIKFNKKNLENKDEVLIKKINSDKNIIFVSFLVLVMMINIFLSLCFLMDFYPITILIITTALFLISLILIFVKKKILYVILIINILIIIITLIYCMPKQYQKNKEDEERSRELGYMVDEVALNAFNSKFNTFEGEKRGSQIKSLCNLVLQNNISKQNEEFGKISIYGIITVSISDNEIIYNENFDISKLYNVKMHYSKYGLLKSISIEESK